MEKIDQKDWLSFKKKWIGKYLKEQKYIKLKIHGNN